jgi:hypothetical protein
MKMYSSIILELGTRCTREWPASRTGRGLGQETEEYGHGSRGAES